jgi:epsilon-lactone hydrolase
LIRAAGVLAADNSRRIMLYLHGGAFLTGGPNTHSRLVSMLSKYADTRFCRSTTGQCPSTRSVTHSMIATTATDGCVITVGSPSTSCSPATPPEATSHLHSPNGSSTTARYRRRWCTCRRSCSSPRAPSWHTETSHRCDVSAKALAAFAELIARPTERSAVNANSEQIYEPLDHIEPGLPRTLIHVSGSEVLPHDAQLAARELAAAGVPVEIRIWPGQIHVFQLAAPIAPEATRSLRHICQYIRDTTDRRVAPRIRSARYPVSPATLNLRSPLLESAHGPRLYAGVNQAAKRSSASVQALRSATLRP